MKEQTLKKLYTLAALAYIAGAVFFCCGFWGALPRGVYINGLNVGGMRPDGAKRFLRECIVRGLEDKRLRICAGEEEYVYAYPEIDFYDDIDEVLKKVKAKGEYFCNVKYYLNGAEEIAENLCAGYSRPVEEPHLRFNRTGEPFTYFAGNDGAECDRQKLLEDIDSSLNGNFSDVHVCTTERLRKCAVEDLKKDTCKLYCFSTCFDSTNAARTANIRLAAEKINGTVLLPGEVFSFNGVVGERSEERGFKQAKIIKDGKFVYGFGGGVCQVSTTLYNAALLSGMEIVEYHPHSLQVGYVSPSRDAMVSGSYYDMKFKNTGLTPVYIRVNCSLNAVECTLYGRHSGKHYSFRHEVTKRIERPPATVIEGDEDGVISYGRDGVESEGYLVCEEGGRVTERLIRRDRYPAAPDVLQQKRTDV